MNRAERRGNAIRSRSSGANGVRLQAAARSRSGVDMDTGKFAPGVDPDQVKEANSRQRGSTGRFESVPSPVPVDVPLSRQQRRYQARMAQKVARAWSQVTDGDGVVLRDGVEVPVKGGS